MPKDGEAIYNLFYLVRNNPNPNTTTLDIPASTLDECCDDFRLMALAHVTDDDEFKNDRSGFLWAFADIISTAVMSLHKCIDGAWEEQEALNDDDFGTFYELSFFVNDDGEKYIGYQLNWQDVLIEYGEGLYKVVVDYTLSIGGEGSQETPEYKLQAYTAAIANGTVKVEYYQNGAIGDYADDTKRFDFGTLNWYNSYRLPGFFGFPKSTYTKDYVEYENGQRLWVQDEAEPEYTLKLKPVSAFIHSKLRVDVLQADQIYITDYNSKNADTFIQKSVQATSEYLPNWKILQSTLAGVELKFRQEFNNLKKRRS